MSVQTSPDTIPVGGISIIDHPPRCAVQFGFHDVFPFIERSVAVRASLLVVASELLTRLVDFEVARLARRPDAARLWAKFAELYKDELDLVGGDRLICQVRVENQILDPTGTWSPTRPNHLPILQVA